jgi:8-oxo-dGTP pyrophosphatase MutT (NUDIX family)
LSPRNKEGMMGAGRSWKEMQPNLEDKALPSIQYRHCVFATPYQNLYQIGAQFGDYAKDYFVNEWGIRAGLVVDLQGDILLVRQYRLLIDDISWEIPGGAIDEGEKPVEAASRECLEETGVRCNNLKPLLFYHLGLDTAYNPTHLFFSTDAVEEPESGKIDCQEVSGSEWIPLEHCIDMIWQKKIQDSFSVIALLAYSIFKNRRME